MASSSSSSSSLSSRLVGLALYTPAPFFGYPWKPVLNYLLGGRYAESYGHFRAQHMGSRNLLYHFLCLGWQLGSNYALLDDLDEAIVRMVPPRLRAITRRPLALSNSLLWGATCLATAPTPAPVKLASCVSLYLAHNYLGQAFRARWKGMIYAQSFIEAAAINVNLRGKNALLSKFTVVYMLLRSLLCRYLLGRFETNTLLSEERKRQLRRGFVALMVAIGLTKQPLKPTVTMGLYGWIVALLTGSKTLYFWSCGMMATLGQSVAHGVTKEAATLVVLQGGMEQIEYEFSHVVFFPNLLFQAVYEQLGFS